MHEPESILAGKRRGRHAELLEVVQNVQLDPLQPLLGDSVAVGLDAERDIPRLFQAVVPLGKLRFEHLRILGADLVEGVAPERHENALLHRVVPAIEVQEGELEANRRVEVVQKVAPALEDGGFVVILGKLIVDVLETDGLGVQCVGDTANAVRPHPLIGNAVLRRGRLFPARALRALNGRVDLFFVCVGEFYRGGFSGQCFAPPCRAPPADAERRRSCWFGMAAPVGGGSAVPRCF